MSKFLETFGNRPVLLPVIHTVSGEQAVENCRIAIGGGANGVFLINHDIGYRDLIAAYEEVKSTFPSLWVGLNCLDLGIASISKIPIETSGLWVDDSAIYDTGVETDAVVFEAGREERDWRGLYFGGVAHKGQRVVKDVAVAAANAVPFVDVITTTGPRTGEAPPVSQIKTMREAAGEHPIVIASGMSEENVEEYLPYGVNGIMVASSI